MKSAEVISTRQAILESKEAPKLYEMLTSVEFNVTELCTRTCTFCPRSDPSIYKNRKRHISVETITNACNSLSEIEYDMRVTFAGFGEPLLHPDLYSCISACRDILPKLKVIEIITNGDMLTKEIAKQLSGAGLSNITVSMYDKDISDNILKIFKSTGVTVRCKHNYSSKNNYNIDMVNRSEILRETRTAWSSEPCYIPFHKSIVDWNGDILLCSNDWSRNNTFGNVNEKDFVESWLTNLEMYRVKLISSRKGLSPCSNCNVNGIKSGCGSVSVYNKNVA